MYYYIIKRRNLQNNEMVYITFLNHFYLFFGEYDNSGMVCNGALEKFRALFFYKHFDSLCQGEYNKN